MAGDDVELTTERLLVRRLRPEDAAVVAAYRSDPEVARWQGWTVPYAEEAARFLIAEVADQPIGALGWAQLGIELRATGELLGDVAVHGVDDHTVEVGYTLARSHWGHGYATEAVGAMVDLLLGTLAFPAVHAEVAPENAPSIALLDRLGFTLDATLDDGFLRYRCGRSA